MTLEEFLADNHARVRADLADPNGSQPFEESVFTELVMQHMADIGMTADPAVCHYTAVVSRAKVKISGYAASDDGEELDLFVTLYSGADTLQAVPDGETERAAEVCLQFVRKCAEGKLAATMDESNDAYMLAFMIQEGYPTIQEIRIYVLTDRVAKAKNFKPREVAGKTIKLEVMDIERLHRHWSEGKPRDELAVNFEDIAGAALPCVYVPGEAADYDYALTVIPGEVLRHIYERYGARLLEANVRSFLTATGKVNRGIRDTLRADPEKFMAFNNGIVLVADEAHIRGTPDGGTRLIWLKGMQIVNGGQTTASIYFTMKRYPEVDLRKVRIPAKIIVLHGVDEATEEALIADISKYANSQNAVKQSDLHANKPYHIELERLSNTTYCPDGVGRWFYERAAGSYNTMLAREGTTPAKLKALKAAIPNSRKITKTDLAKYLNAWNEQPANVSAGSQKNFERFMEATTGNADDGTPPDATAFKRIIAKAIIYKAAQKLIRPLFPAFQANITTYTVSLVARRLGPHIDLDRIWQQQAIPASLERQITIWSGEVARVLNETSGGRMISEWAKRPECWNAVREVQYSRPLAGAPEAVS
ncbi:abortive phage infection protein [Methylobacterium sp. Leaf469]|uniref:AIPR family protein n=1 Tax=Methylobacterium sp. Leaf469 TaxID=1736387 RepID=UPI0006F6698D|nr:AIPR family protein [Methylobacterium sp. Leaf469]KQU01808.1 abortive phage infection protein [Methylobacterium sp. Leaf469]